MEWMIKKGMPQRRAHHLVGAIVGAAMERKVPLKDLPLETLKEHAPELDESVYECLGTQNAVAAFVSYGSTAPTQVRNQIDHWKSILTK
jgi:argininosuccinate lyase